MVIGVIDKHDRQYSHLDEEIQASYLRPSGFIFLIIATVSS